MVLTAVALGAFAAQLLIQRPLEDRQMTDVVAAKQIIRGIIGLEVSHHRLFDVLGEERLVTVEETIRLPLFAELQDSFTHRVHGVGGQHIVVVSEGKIFARRQRLGGVGVGGDALIFDLFVYDSLIFLLIFPYNALHLGVGVVGSVREAELTIGGGLVHKGAQKFPQVIFGRIIQRGQDGDGGQAAVLSGLADHFGGLSFQHLFAGQIARPLAEETAADKARAPLYHRGQALVFRELDGIAHQLFGAFESYIHIQSLCLAPLHSLVGVADSLGVAVHLEVAVAQPCHLAAHTLDLLDGVGH